MKAVMISVPICPVTSNVSTLIVEAASVGADAELVESIAAGDEVSDADVCGASCAVKWIERRAFSSCFAVRSIVMGTAGLWYFNLTSSSRHIFLRYVSRELRQSM